MKLFQPFIQADGTTTRKYGGTGWAFDLETTGGTMGGRLVSPARLSKVDIWFTATFEKQPPMQRSRRRSAKASKSSVL